MKRREIIRTLGIGAVSLALGQLTACRIFQRRPSSKNWAWVVPVKGNKVDYWKEKLETAKGCGIDALVVEVYNGRTAFYDTDRFPVEEDLLSILLPLCKSMGLELHTWLWTMPCNVESIVKTHPNWYAVNGKGELACEKPAYVDYYKFLCPSNEEAREFIRGNVESLARISEIDGVHLDYVRLPDVILAPGIQPKYNIVQDKEYPEYDYCYCKTCREQFKAGTGIDPLIDLVDPSANREWRQFRYDSVTNLVNQKLVHAARKYGKVISAAVFPNWEHVRQEWSRWDLDCFMPMLYHSFYNQDVHWIAGSIRKEIQELKRPRPLYSGLFVPSLKPLEIEIAFTESLAAGASGIVLFELKSMNEEQWSALKAVAG
ncbi:MAG TPA: family 10 glycosylhydrolase [Bacteroidota bacterium]|nr:family 10 glycosylhydrolase [Bacteroidota bacterium]